MDDDVLNTWIDQLPDQGVVWIRTVSDQYTVNKSVMALDFSSGEWWSSANGYTSYFSQSGRLRGDQATAIVNTTPGRVQEPPISRGWEFPAANLLTAKLFPELVDTFERDADGYTLNFHPNTDDADLYVSVRYTHDGTPIESGWGQIRYDLTPRPVNQLPELLWPSQMPGADRIYIEFLPDATLSDPAVRQMLASFPTDGEFLRVPPEPTPIRLTQGSPRDPELDGTGLAESNLPTALVITGIIIAVLGIVGWMRSRG